MKLNAVRVVRGVSALVALLAIGTTAFAQAPAGGQGRGVGMGRPPLIMTTTAWEDGGVIPEKYTALAGDKQVSPAFSWSQVPEGTRSFVLLMHDLEPVLNRSAKMDITHWLVWNIPGTATGLPEGVALGELPDGTRQVSLRSNGYMGPGAPPGPYHHYVFELFALDATLDVPAGTPQQANQTRTAIFDAMEGHVLGKAVIVGRFHR